MRRLEVYYLRQAGGGGGSYNYNNTGIGPIYSTPPHLQRGHGIGNVFGSLFRWIKPILWSGAKALGRESLRTGGKILSDIAENRSSITPSSDRDIISRNLTESRQKLIDKLEGRGKKKRAASRKRRAAPKKIRNTKRAKLIKRDIFS